MERLHTRSGRTAHRMSLGVLLSALLLVGMPAVGRAQVSIDFDTTGPTSDGELETWFDFLGVQTDFWIVDPNTQNPANGSNALRAPGDGGSGGSRPLSRAAILKASFFEEVNAEFTVDLTWDDEGGDANDEAGVYIRFIDENNFYYVDFNAGNVNSPAENIVDVVRRKGGINTTLVDNATSPVPLAEGDTITVTVRVAGSEIFVLVNGLPVPGISPAVDGDPLLAPGRVGVGQHSNPLFADNLTASALNEPGLLPGNNIVAEIDGSVRMLLIIPQECNAAADVAYNVGSSNASVVSADPVDFPAAGVAFSSFDLNINGPGEATLTPTAAAGSPAVCTAIPSASVTVHAFESMSLRLNTTMGVGNVQQASVTGQFGPAGIRNLTAGSTGTVYQSSDPDVLSVNEDGLVTAVSLGDATITATNRGFTETVRILAVSVSTRVTDGILALYDFEEGEGSVIHDVSGVDPPLDLTMRDPDLAIWGPGFVAYEEPYAAMASDGPADKIIQTIALGPDPTEEFTLEAWVLPYDNTTDQDGPARIISCSATSGSRNFGLLQSADEWQVRMRSTARTGNGCPCDFDTAPLTAMTRLHHVVFTRDVAGTGIIYVDGAESLRGDGLFGGNLSNWDPGMLLLLGQEDNIGGGLAAKAARDFRGEFHLVAIFSRALNAQEVNRNFRAGPVACVDVGEVQHIPDFAVNLASVDVPTVVPVTVGIPSPANGSVTVTSSNPAVADGGATAFAAFTDETCGAIAINVSGVGSTVLELSNDMGFANGTSRTINVIPLQSLSVEFFGFMGLDGDPQSIDLNAEYGEAGPRPVAASQASFSSDDEAVATVDARGVITPRGIGTTTIRATVEGVEGTAAIRVVEHVTSIALVAGDSIQPAGAEGLQLDEADEAVVEFLGTLRFSGNPGQLDPNGVPPRVEGFMINDFIETGSPGEFPLAREIDAKFDLLITSSTTQSQAEANNKPDSVAGQFRCLSIPHLFWADVLHSPLHEGLAGSGFDGALTLDCPAGIFVIDNGHPITQGLPLTDNVTLNCIDVFDSEGQTVSIADTGSSLATGARSLAEADVGQGLIVVAGPNGDPDIPGGDGLRVDGTSPFLGRRVSFYLWDDLERIVLEAEFDSFLPQGLELFERSVNWALAGERVPCGAGGVDECTMFDCNGNGTSDTCDIADGTEGDCNRNGTPDSCEPDSDGDGVIDDCEVQDLPPPELVSVMGGLGVTADAFISPLGEDVPFDSFGLETTIAVEDLTAATVCYTGAGDAPQVAGFDAGADGSTVVQLDRPIGAGNRLVLNVTVTGVTNGSGGVAAQTAPNTFQVSLGHQPLDINQDGSSNIRDATAFGDEFRGDSAPPLIDINGDGVVNVRDATAFGNNWNGVAGLQTWRNTNLADCP